MTSNQTFSKVANQLGVWLLTAAATAATTEMLHNAAYAAVPAQTGNGHVSQQTVQEAFSARAEGAKESARLPEEYDIGLRMPAIAGS